MYTLLMMQGAARYTKVTATVEDKDEAMLLAKVWANSLRSRGTEVVEVSSGDVVNTYYWDSNGEVE